MAKYTREQVIKWNEQAQNGFRLDMSMLMYHNEKTLEKIVKRDDSTHVRYRLSFWEVRQNYRFSHYVIKLNKSIWYTTNGSMATSHGLGYNVVVSEKEYSKKTYKELCTISGQLPEDLETLFADKTVEDAGRGMVLSSPLC